MNRSLRNLYLWRVAFSATWVALVSTVSAHQSDHTLNTLVGLLLIAYPIADVAATIADLRATSTGEATTAQRINAAVGAAATIAIGIAAPVSLTGTMDTFAGWAIISGAGSIFAGTTFIGWNDSSARPCLPLRGTQRSMGSGCPGEWHVGNAVRESAGRRGWFVGPFLDPNADIRATSDLEIKWAQPLANDRRSDVVVDERRTTVVILVEGRCQIQLSTGSFVLSAPGDYAMWGPGVDHSWRALQDSTLITVRWWP